ncbi:MAG: asparagine synthase (glutamine-hydrolyzing) [Salibacteraceae bacterium]|nr:asparagine synthase (glutamine-hydrolyzing) [Salibacteraceae bacterium]|tara:strand:+ start:18402 stop:20342 length:1941 start_codon:yes stop_codon:yes gene_type:complete
MCGITGVVSLNSDQSVLETVSAATGALEKRGPDAEGYFSEFNIALGHRRLSIIDTDNSANQPMFDPSERFVIVFNGEFYNYKVYREMLESKGVIFKTNSDTEVLLQLYISEKENCLEKINGFFALAIFDKVEKSLFIARDRIGIKPLVYTFQENFFAFASELKALVKYPLQRSLDKVSIFNYLQLNYIPAPNTIFENVHKLEPGQYLKINNIFDLQEEERTPVNYYSIPKPNFTHEDLNPLSYETAKTNFMELLKESVQRRMVSDVPLGAFLSGGIDSSVICALASRYSSKLKTFSIGFKDHPFFDETDYAEEVAEKFKTDHTTFKLTNQDLLDHVEEALDYIDEPFADSSAINMFILSKKTRKEIKVALSGDGADEMFAGYNKHAAEFKARNPGNSEKVAATLAPLLNPLPKNRDSKIWNVNRQLQRFAMGMKLSPKERYWQWATFRNEETANYLLHESNVEKIHRLTDGAYDYKKRKERILKSISKDGTLNEALYTDMQLVLPNDMLFKVDHMSMANGLEVRTPFLDHNLVNFAFEIPVQFKINQNIRKKIVQDSFRTILPERLYNRPKKGFEIPVTSWLKGELNHLITADYFSQSYIVEQGLFNWPAVEKQLKKLQSNDVGNASGTIWNLMVFQRWYIKYMHV